MPLYEVMFIVQPNLEGEALEESILRVKDVIEKEKGTVVLLKKLGKRRLAYEINDFREGSYVLLNVQAGREMVPVLEHFFKVNEGYLRYIVIRIEEGKLEDKIANVPAENVPVENVPVENVPVENVPVENVPVENIPAENVPAEEVNAEEVNAESVLTENVSAEKAAAGSAPVEKVGAGDDVDDAPEAQDEEPGEE